MGEECVQRFDSKARRKEPIRKTKRQIVGKYYTGSWRNRLEKY
jgi:hypothetical protein